MRGLRLRYLVFATWVLAGVAAAAPTFPPLTGRVVDDAHLLSDSARAQLTAELAEHERKTTEQVVVVTLPSLQGYPIEDYGYRLGRRWGIGQAKQNNGALFIVAPTEHAVRIEVGYGLEGRLTDALSSEIINTQVLPAFRKNNYQAGILQGTHAILAVLDGTYVPAAHPAPARPSVLAVWALFILLILLAFVLLPFLRYAQHPGMGPGGPYGGWGGGFGGGGFGGGGGGGFSGGGGSFGGGGASGRW